MNVKAIYSGSKSRVLSNFKKESLQATKNKVSSSLYSQKDDAKMSAKVVQRQETVSAKQDERANTALQQRLIRAGARPEVASLMADAVKNKMSVSLDDLQMSHASATKLFDSLVTGTKAGKYDAITNGARNGKAFASLTALALASNGKGSTLVNGRLREMTQVAESDTKGLGVAINHLGNALLENTSIFSGSAFAGRRAGEITYGLGFRDASVISNKEKVLSKLTGRAAASVSLSLQSSKQSVGVSLSKVATKMVQGQQEALRKTANAAGSLAAASRPMAAVLSAPVVASAAIGIAGVATAVVISAGAVAVAASPVLAAKTVLVDGITGGPGLAKRTAELSQGKDIRNHLGLPSAQQLKAGKSRAASAARKMGSVFSSLGNKRGSVNAI